MAAASEHRPSAEQVHMHMPSPLLWQEVAPALLNVPAGQAAQATEAGRTEDARVVSTGERRALPGGDAARTLAAKVADGRLERARGAHRAGAVGRVVVAGLAQALRRAGGAGGRRHAAGRAVGAAGRAKRRAVRVERARRARPAAHARVARLALCARVVDRVRRGAANVSACRHARNVRVDASMARTRAGQRRGRARVVGAVAGRALFAGAAARAGAVLADRADCARARGRSDAQRRGAT